MGSMNFGLYEMIPALQGKFKHDWEQPYLEGSDERIFKNTFRTSTTSSRSCSGNDTRFEIECYDIGHLYTAAHFLDRGLVKPPLFIQSVFGIRGGIGPHPEDVHAHETHGGPSVRRRLPLVGARRGPQPDARRRDRAAMGGNVRVGLEDSLWIGAGKLAKRMPSRSPRCARSLKGLGWTSPAPDEAREILSLKGGDKVAF